jgi:hypothetical protein
MQEDKRLPIKAVGRQGKSKVDMVTIDSMQRAVNVLRRGKPFLPKGVWRFKSFEEADEWKLKMLTRRRSPESQR